VAYAISDGIARATRAESRARGMVSRGVNTFSGGTYMCRLLGLPSQPQRSSAGSSPATSAGRGHGGEHPTASGVITASRAFALVLVMTTRHDE